MRLVSIIFFALLSEVPAVLVGEAEQSYRAGRLEEAFSRAAQAADSAEVSADTTNLIKALCIQADAAIDLGDDAMAVKLYDKCAELTPFGEPMFKLSSSLYNIATIYFQNGEYDKAQEYVTKSINIDSRRASDSILALRYLLAAEIAFEKGDYDGALAYVGQGRECAGKKKNYNVEARLMLVEARCKEAMCGLGSIDSDIEGEYVQALKTLNTMLPGFYYGAVNPFAAEFLYRAGCAVAAQGKDAKHYFIDAIRSSGTSQKMRGVNPLINMEASLALAEIYKKEGNEVEASKYSAIAERLSYAPYVQEMGSKLSLSQMEFIRREKEREIEKHKENIIYLIVTAALLAAICLSLLLMYRHLLKQKRQIEQKNAQLVKLVLQKDQLLSMVENRQQPDSSDLKKIADDNVPIPEINLSKRETEVLALCCQGLLSKEIADRLNVSVRTVESHKLNIFRKVGVNTTNELIAFAFKSGIIKLGSFEQAVKKGRT